MSATIDGYFSISQTVDTFWNGVAADEVGQWLLVIHALGGGVISDMEAADPGDDLGWPAGAWQLLAQVDAGDGFPKIRVWATRFTDTTSRSFMLPTGSDVDGHSHLYFLSGLRDGDRAEQVFSVGARTSADSATSQELPLYAPDDGGLLIGAWISGGLVDYSDLDTLTARTELDGDTSTSRAGEETLTTRGPDTRTATASAAQAWAAVSIVAREPGGTISGAQTTRTEIAPGVNPDADPATWAADWVDVTEDVYKRDSITIERGRGDEDSAAKPSEMAMTLNDKAGKYVRLNPLGPYYGKLRKNTPARVWVDPGSGMDLRNTGFVAEWPPRSRFSGIGEYMPITASGVMRRLAQGEVFHSPLYRRVAADAATVGYWPLEADASSGLVGGSAMRVVGEVSFSTPGGPPGSAGEMTADNNGKAFGPVSGMQDTGAWSVSWWINLPDDFDADLESSMLVGWETPGATHRTWGARVAPGNDGAIGVGILDDAGNAEEIVSTVDLRGRGWVLVTVMASITAGTDTLAMLQLSIPGEAIRTTTLSGELPAPVTTAYINGPVGPTVDIKGSVCHLLTRSEPQVTGSSLNFALQQAGAGYAGERAVARIRRLSDETGLPIIPVGDDGASAPMGPQPVGKLLEILQDVEKADGGMLYELRDGRLAYQPRNARYNATAKLSLDYSTGDILPPLESTDDDKASRNDWTISRQGGGSARVVDQDSKEEIGEYPDSDTINADTDDQLPHEAGWRVHLGTVNGLRYPAVTPNLFPRPGVIADWLSLDVGDAATITSPGRDLEPGDIPLVVEGYTETFRGVEWRAITNCSPGRPWIVGVLDDDDLDGLDTSGSTLAGPLGEVELVASEATLNDSATSSVVVDVPAGTLAGHVMIARVGLISQVAVTAPTGWTLIGTQDAGSAVRYAAYRKVAGTDEPDSYTWSWTGTFKNSGTIETFSGVDTSDPIAGSDSTGSNTDGTSFATAAVTVPKGGRLSAGAFERHAATGSATTWTDASDTEQVDDGSASASGQDVSHAVYTSAAQTAETSISRTLTASQTVSQVATWAIALAPATTTLLVEVTDGPLWTTDEDDFPFEIEVSGVVLEVTAITGSSSPQTFTITATPVNGVVKTIPSGEAVRLAQPMILSL